MNQTHIHLLITHLPIFGSILGGLVLAHGLWTKSNQTKIAAYNLFIISAIGAGIASNSGKKGDAKAIKESKPDWTKPTAPAPSTDANTNSVAKRVLKSAGRYKFAKGGFKKK